jgi:hypothetical protein
MMKQAAAAIFGVIFGILLSILIVGCDGGSGAKPKPKHLEVFLWGDSITLWYAPTVVDLCGDQCSVWTPTWYNGMTSPSLASSLKYDQILRDGIHTFDVFHLNAGIHDDGQSEEVTSYVQGWKHVLNTIQELAPGAPIVLATTTLKACGDNSRILLYNEAIKDLVKEYEGVTIDDMAALQASAPLVQVDCLHFDGPSGEKMGQQAYLSILNAAL